MKTEIPKIDTPSIRITETIGGYWRGYLHGINSLRSEVLTSEDSGFLEYGVIELANGKTKEEVIGKISAMFSLPVLTGAE